MKKKNRVTRFCSLLLAAALLFGALVPASAAAEPMYANNLKQTAAAIQYLNDMYLADGAGFALAQQFGSRADQALLAKLCETVVAGCETESEKAFAIANWVNENIAYDMQYEMVSYPIDVYYEGRAVCYGYAMMISRLMRLAGIPAVRLSGMRGDMKHTITVNNFRTMLRDFSHAWVMAYYGNAWHLFDPLFDTMDLTSPEEMAAWYFCNDVEGVAPYYDGMDMFLTNDGLGIFPVNGRLMLYSNGQPGAVSGMGQLRNGMNLHCMCALKEGDTFADSWRYVESPERKNDMLSGQVYTDGFLQIDWLRLVFYANKNGICKSSTVGLLDNALYAVGQGGDYYLLKNVGERQFYAGRPTVNVGEKVKLGVTWYDAASERKMNVTWISRTPETASVDEKGVVTVLAPGDICIYVQMRYDDVIEGVNIDQIFYLWGAKEKRVCAGSYALDESALPRPNDVNADGNITTADARAALRAAIGLDELGIVARNAADLNDDGLVTTADARLLLRAAIGLITL